MPTSRKGPREDHFWPETPAKMFPELKMARNGVGGEVRGRRCRPGLPPRWDSGRKQSAARAGAADNRSGGPKSFKTGRNRLKTAFLGVLRAQEGLKSGFSAGKQEICMKTGRERAFILQRNVLRMPSPSPGNAALLDCAEKLPVVRNRYPPWTVGGRRNVAPRCRFVRKGIRGLQTA